MNSRLCPELDVLMPRLIGQQLGGAMELCEPKDWERWHRGPFAEEDAPSMTGPAQLLFNLFLYILRILYFFCICERRVLLGKKNKTEMETTGSRFSLEGIRCSPPCQGVCSLSRAWGLGLGCRRSSS